MKTITEFNQLKPFFKASGFPFNVENNYTIPANFARSIEIDKNRLTRFKNIKCVTNECKTVSHSRFEKK